MLEDTPKEGEALKIKGSVMMALAETKEEVLEKLKADVYAKGEVWDFNQVRGSLSKRKESCDQVVLLTRNFHRSKLFRSSLLSDLRFKELRCLGSEMYKDTVYEDCVVLSMPCHAVYRESPHRSTSHAMLHSVFRATGGRSSRVVQWYRQLLSWNRSHIVRACPSYRNRAVMAQISFCVHLRCPGDTCSNVSTRREIPPVRRSVSRLCVLACPLGDVVKNDWTSATCARFTRATLLPELLTRELQVVQYSLTIPLFVFDVSVEQTILDSTIRYSCTSCPSLHLHQQLERGDASPNHGPTDRNQIEDIPKAISRCTSSHHTNPTAGTLPDMPANPQRST